MRYQQKHETNNREKPRSYIVLKIAEQIKANSGITQPYEPGVPPLSLVDPTGLPSSVMLSDGFPVGFESLLDKI